MRWSYSLLLSPALYLSMAAERRFQTLGAALSSTIEYLRVPVIDCSISAAGRPRIGAAKAATRAGSLMSF